MMLVDVIFTRSAILGDDDDGEHEDDGDHDDGEHEDVGDEDDQLTHHQVGHILSLAPHTPALVLDIANESVFQFQLS